MKDFQKLLWSRNGSQVDLSLNLEKIDQTNRVVVGFATLDNIDFADDIVPLDAAFKAFETFRGNVRFQHDKGKPVGRVIDFAPGTYYDEETKETHEGIQVAVRISDGAEDVWKMCVDGTLSGFSIGGTVKKAKKVYSETLRKNIQVIEEFMLTELSVVDSPMNRLANIVAIHKSLDCDTIEKDYDSLNLFWCGLDRIASKSLGEDSNCPKCGEAMSNMGHIEQDTDIEKQLEKVFSNETKGGQPNMKDTTNEVAVEKNIDGEEVASVEETAVEEVPEVEAEGSDEVVEDAEVTEEVADAEKTAEAEDAPVETEEVKEDETLKLLKELQVVLEGKDEKIEKGHEELKGELASLSKGIEEKLQDISEKNSELEKTIDSIKEKLNSTEESLGEVKKGLDAVIDSTAFKKSIDSSSRSESDVQPNRNLFHGVFDPRV